MKYAIPLMEGQGGGSIINISSITSLRHTGVAYTGYYSTKAGMNHLTQTTAVDYAQKNIRVNAILPGLMKTPMVAAAASLADSYAEGDVEEMWRTRDQQCPMGHMGDAWDVANAAFPSFRRVCLRDRSALAGRWWHNAEVLLSDQTQLGLARAAGGCDLQLARRRRSLDGVLELEHSDRDAWLTTEKLDNASVSDLMTQPLYLLPSVSDRTARRVMFRRSPDHDGTTVDPRRIARLAILPVAVLLAAVGLAACGSSDDSTAASSDAATSSLHFIYVDSNPSAEPIGAIINSGLSAASKELGVEVEKRSTKSAEFSPSELKRLIESAIAQKPDGLIISDPEPPALNETIKSATSQGIPVVLAQTGAGQIEATGALTYVGNDEKATGELGGELLKKAGGSHGLLVTLPPGYPIVEERNEGFESGFGGEVTELSLKQFTDVTATTNSLLATLEKDSSINTVFSVGSVFIPALIAVRKQLGDRGEEMIWGTIDISPQALEAVKEGALKFAIDQQPYLQGYLPVLYLKQYLELGLSPVQEQVPTGPAAVTKENAEQILQLSSEKLR